MKTPWGVLAYQLAGDAGFARVKAHEDGYDPPADPVIVDLLREPEKQDLGTLILLDEAVGVAMRDTASIAALRGSDRVGPGRRASLLAAPAGRCTFVGQRAARRARSL